MLLLLALLAQTPSDTVRARAIHERVMTLDTHVDISLTQFTPELNYTTRLPSQVDLVQMEAGGLDAVFLIVYVGQSSGDLTPEGFAQAYRTAMAKFRAIHWLTDTLARDRIGLARTAALAPLLFSIDGELGLDDGQVWEASDVERLRAAQPSSTR